MSTTMVSDRTIVCSNCSKENTLIGSDLSPGTMIHCSSCGMEIGPFAHLRFNHHEDHTSEDNVLQFNRRR